VPTISVRGGDGHYVLIGLGQRSHQFVEKDAASCPFVAIKKTSLFSLNGASAIFGKTTMRIQSTTVVVVKIPGGLILTAKCGIELSRSRHCAGGSGQAAGDLLGS
jgi:hypothetical protein